MQRDIATSIADGRIHHTDRSESIPNIEWKAHPICEGVYLKHLIKGVDTDGLFSSHLVKISPNCRLDTHCHECQLELHEIMDGQGTFRLLDESHDYHLGKMAVIPKGVNHMVQAGEKGLTLLAKFFPALL